MTGNNNLDSTLLQKELQQLRAENMQLKQTQELVAHSPVVVFTWKNAPGWPVENVSPNVINVFGYSSNEFTSGKLSYKSLIAEEDLERVIGEVDKAGRSGKNSFDHEPYRIVQKNGEVRWLRGHTVIIRDNKNQVSHYHGYITDITDEKKIIQEQLQIQTELEHRGNILNIVAYLSQEFLRYPDWNDSIELCFECLGNVTAVDRVYMFKNYLGINDRRMCRQLYEWCDEGVEPQIHKLALQYISWDVFGLDTYYQLERGGEKVLLESVHTQREKQIFQREGVKSLIMFPLTVSNKFWGFIGFDNCKEEKQWNEVEVNTLKMMAGVISAAIQRNIAEQEVKERESFLSSIFRASPTGIALVVDHVVIEMNSTFGTLTGYAYEELVDQSIRMVYSDKNEYERVQQAIYDQVYETGLSKLETTFRKKNGQDISVILNSTWRDIDNPAEGLIITALDITDRKRIEKDLSSGRIRLQTLLEKIPDIIFFKDVSGRWLEANNKLLNLLGLTKSDYRGKTDSELKKRIKPDLSDFLNQCLKCDQQAWAKGRQINAELNVPGNGDKSVMYEFSWLPLYDGSGKAEGMLTIGHDISDYKKRERDNMEDFKKQKEVLIGEVHHRIKNHLHGLMGLLNHRKNNQPELSGIINELITQIDSIAVVYGLQSKNAGNHINFIDMLRAIKNSVSDFSQVPLKINSHAIEVNSKVNPVHAVALSLVINELIINATKHLHDIGDKAEAVIFCTHQDLSTVLTISNPGVLPEGFNFTSGKGLGAGLDMAKAMLPSKWAELSILEKNNNVVAELRLSPPLIIR